MKKASGRSLLTNESVRLKPEYSGQVQPLLASAADSFHDRATYLSASNLYSELFSNYWDYLFPAQSPQLNMLLL